MILIGVQQQGRYGPNKEILLDHSPARASSFHTVVSNTVVCAFKAYWKLHPIYPHHFSLQKERLSIHRFPLNMPCSEATVCCCSLLICTRTRQSNARLLTIVVDSALFLLLKSLEVGFKVPKLWD